jgi:hypothetical protein
MRRYRIVSVGVLVLTAITSAVAVASILDRMSVRVDERAGVQAASIDAEVPFCSGAVSERLAVLTIPDGAHFWEAFPHQPESPEIAEAKTPLTLVIYKGVWPGPVLHRLTDKVEERTPLSGTVDVCIATTNGEDALSGGPYAVYGDVPLADSVISR